MGKIVSSTGAAKDAVSKLSGKDINLSSQPIDFLGSTVPSMIDGLTVANQLILEVSGLSECIWMQAQKFPAIAETISYQDHQAAHNMGGIIL